MALTTRAPTTAAAPVVRRRPLPRLLVRLRRAWRDVCELCGFARAAAVALFDFARGRWA